MGIDAQERTALSEAVREAAAGGPRDFLDDSGRPSRDSRLWKVLTDQMGLNALLVDEEEGGAGAGIAEVVVVLEELAGALAVVPALSSLATATSLLRMIDSAESSSLRELLATTMTTATVSWPTPETCADSAVLTGSGSTEPGAVAHVSGRCDFVLDGGDADILLAPVSVEGRDVIVSIDTSVEGVSRNPLSGLDLTRGLARVDLDNAVGTVIGTVDVSAASDLALVMIAAEQVGIAQHCHDVAVAWARERVQFDRPIGQFQAIKHQLVDLLMRLELARSALDVAVSAADRHLVEQNSTSARELRVAASVAKAACGDAAMVVADESLHILGGIGFTWEHDAHLYFRRAKVLEVLLGSPAAHRARFATTLLEEARRG